MRNNGFMQTVALAVTFTVLVSNFNESLAADLSHMWHVVGGYKLLKWNDTATAGELNVKITEDSLGFEVITDIAKKTVLTPTVPSILQRIDLGLSQVYVTDQSKTEVIYEFDGINLLVSSNECTGAQCVVNRFSAVKTNFGPEINFKDFTAAVGGQYQIFSVNGKPPSGDNNSADVTTDTEEGLYTFPYCLDDGLCVPGYLTFAYTETKAFEKSIATDHRIVFFVVKNRAQTAVFSWEQSSRGVTFRNYRNRLPSQKVMVLEFRIAASFPFPR